MRFDRGADEILADTDKMFTSDVSNHPRPNFEQTLYVCSRVQGMMFKLVKKMRLIAFGETCFYCLQPPHMLETLSQIIDLHLMSVHRMRLLASSL